MTVGLYVAGVPAAHALAPFSIQVNYSGDVSYRAAFDQAAATWQNYLPSYIDGRNNSNVAYGPLVITASVGNIDNAGGTLGQAGPTSYVNDGSYNISRTGTMMFDSSDFSNGSSAVFQDVVLHEMGHVLGIGTLWELNNLYSNTAGSVTDPKNFETVGCYTGANAVAAWISEYGGTTNYVPIEKGGGGGTANGHWNEGPNGGATGYISNINGTDFNKELMTGFLNTPAYLSTVTLGGLKDLGFVVAMPVPEASTSLLFASSLVSLLSRRRRTT